LHLSAENRLLLGTVGWRRQDWDHGYYPDDLPPDWHLAYLANDADCVFLPESAWRLAAAPDWLAELDEAPPDFVFLLRLGQPADAVARAALERFAGQRVVLLVDRPEPQLDTFEQWPASGTDAWAAAGGSARLLRWSIDTFDLRRLRERAATAIAAGPLIGVVIDGPGADPGRLPELRLLFELLGHG
jgi:hypothetical protein